MEQLLVNYHEIDDLKKKIDTANTFFNKRINTIGSNKRGIDGVSSSRSYLDSAVSELYGIENTINDKIDKLNDFKIELNDFETAAMDADLRVANRIASTTSSFCYTTGIGVKNTEKKSLWQQLSDWVEDKWNGLKNGWNDFTDMVVDWYQENKDAIWAGVKLFTNVLFCALAVVAFIATLPASGFLAICGVIAAGFALAKSISDVYTSAASFACYCNGDTAGGELWAQRSLKDGFLMVGRKFDEAFHTEVFEDAASYLYTGLEVFSAVYGVVKFGKDMLKAFKLDKLSWNNITKRSWNQNKAWFKSINWKDRLLDKDNWKNAIKKVIGYDSVELTAAGDVDRRFASFKKFAKSFKWLDTESVTALYKFKTWGGNAKSVYKTVEHVFDGNPDTKWHDEIKIMKTMNDLQDKVFNNFTPSAAPAPAYAGGGIGGGGIWP